MASEIGDNEQWGSVRGKINVFLQFRAETTQANPSIDSSSYLQNLLNLAGSLATGNSRAIVLIDAHFYGNEMLTVPNLVDVEMTTNGAYNVSGTTMLTGFFVLNTQGTRMKNVRVIGSGQGSQPANHAGSPLASEVRLSGSGIIFAGVKNGVIENCFLENCGGTTGVLPYNGVAGIWLTYGCQNCVVERNHINNCRNGINEDNYFQVSPRGNKIINNWINGCRFGIALDSDASATDTFVSGNSVKDCQQSGIDLNKAQRVRVMGNHLENCGLQNGNHGIWEYGTASIPAFDNLIEGNTCIGGTGSGIKSGPYVYYSSILGNKCINNILRGVHIIGQNRYWMVAQNHCRGNGQDGILVFSLSPDVTTTGSVDGNICLQNGRNGILLDGAAECNVVNNIIKGNSTSTANTYDGIRLTNGVTLSQVNNNQIDGGNHRYCIAGTDSNTLGNTFQGNKLQAGATGTKAFSNLNQFWGDNGDAIKTTSGAPDNSFPYGTLIRNISDKKLYLRDVTGSWIASSVFA